MCVHTVRIIPPVSFSIVHAYQDAHISDEGMEGVLYTYVSHHTIHTVALALTYAAQSYVRTYSTYVHLQIHVDNYEDPNAKEG